MANTQRMPLAFIPHGGGPWPFVDMGFDKLEAGRLVDYLTGLRDLPPVPPKAVLMISAHWEEPVPMVMTGATPALYFDYYGFAPEVAKRVRELLKAANIDSAENGERGFDHGTFVPMLLTYPKADVPTLQLS